MSLLPNMKQKHLVMAFKKHRTYAFSRFTVDGLVTS